MNQSPYETLGVPPDATPGEIKKAKQTHTDTGGRAEDFHQVKKSYDLLADPDRRRLFDETGDTQDPSDFKKEVHRRLQGVILHCVDQHDPGSHDIIQLALGILCKRIAEVQSARAKCLADAKHYKIAAARCTRSKSAGPGPNIVSQAIEARALDAQKQADLAAQEIKTFEAVIQELKIYRWKTDEAQADIRHNFSLPPGFNFTFTTV